MEAPPAKADLLQCTEKPMKGLNLWGMGATEPLRFSELCPFPSLETLTCLFPSFGGGVCICTCGSLIIQVNMRVHRGQRSSSDVIFRSATLFLRQSLSLA